MIACQPRKTRTLAALTSSESNEWYTPAKYIEAARALMGGIDLDPASCAEANEVVKASRYFDQATDGLCEEWAGRVWLNPPYGRARNGESNQEVWSRALVADWLDGHVSQAVLLVNACTDAAWFQRLWNFPICFVAGRIRFSKGGAVGASPTKGSAIVYLPPDGNSGSRFCELFGGFGRCVLPGGA